MALTAISSILTAGLIRIGYKIAENRKWLPKSIYHRLSVKKIKEGDLKQAHFFNSVAIKKHPDYENALIMRDIISMRKDAQSDRIKRMITTEEDNIQTLLSLKNENEKLLKKQQSKNSISRILNIFIFFLVMCCSYIGIFYLKNVNIKFAVWLTVFIILSLALYIIFYRIFDDNKKIKETILRQERIAKTVTYNRLIKVREKRINVFMNELKEISIN
ncbi:hypothetical protein JXQ31_09915 [candidate division KSB1 bacterium]|nr:hypothetical protein [candidate division KSB1 bacterium]